MSIVPITMNILAVTHLNLSMMVKSIHGTSFVSTYNELRSKTHQTKR